MWFDKVHNEYNHIWVTEKLQLASSYTLMRLIQHFCLNVSVNHYWVFVITNNVDFGQMMRQKYVISNIYVEDTQLQTSVWREETM